MKLNLTFKSIFYIIIVGVLIFLYIFLHNVQLRQDVLLHKRIDYVEVSIKSLLQRLDSFNTGFVLKNATHKEITLRNHSQELNAKTEMKLKYILQWTNPKGVPFVYMGEGRNGFIERNCTYTNCYVTGNRTFLSHLTKFDLIAFAGPEVVRMSPYSFPNKRSPHQKYVFATIESADYYPVCSNNLNNIFNWTWTFKLDSEAKWGYIVVRDEHKTIIGPKKIMQWMKLSDMEPVSDELKEKLRTKSKAAAWFVSNCYSKSGRERFVQELQQKLKKYNLNVDIYGNCGPLKCPRDKLNECNKKINDDYYFYLSFENSFSEDYVTEKLLYPLQNNAVPIVFGGANYTRFMPDGIYLNARELGVKKLADKINELIQNPDQYAEYFRWKKHYSYYRRFESVETDDYCSFCAILNNEELVKKTSIYKDFRKWWDPPGKC